MIPDPTSSVHKAIMETMILHSPLRMSGHESVISAPAYNLLCRVGDRTYHFHTAELMRKRRLSPAIPAYDCRSRR